jgi:cardiolipin synthase
MGLFQLFFEFIKPWIWIPLGIAYIGIIFVVLLENRNVNKALSYIVILIFVPVLGLIVFYFFGRDFRKRIRFKFRNEQDLNTIKEFQQELIHNQENALKHLESEFGSLSKPARMLINEQSSFLLSGNETKLLINGEEKFPEIVKDLKSARHHIHLEYYIFSDDDVGREILEILIEKSNEGVEIRILVDGAGSSDLGSIPEKLKKNGIKLYRFMPVRFKNLASTNYRNHRKMIIIDGKIGFIGGLNIDERYLNNGKHKLYWRDTHLRIEGPAVNILQLVFSTDWRYVSKKLLPMDEPYFSKQLNTSEKSPITIIASGPISLRPYGMDSMVSLIHNARKNIKITNPYFIPSDEFKGALNTAALSGIDVKIILPGISDSTIVQRASNSYLKPFLYNGVNIYQYRKGFIHAKTMTVDDKISLVGSFNTDIRSFYINYEASALVYDKELTRELNNQFEEDLSNSSRLDYYTWKKRSINNRLLDSICRLITPLL